MITQLIFLALWLVSWIAAVVSFAVLQLTPSAVFFTAGIIALVGTAIVERITTLIKLTKLVALHEDERKKKAAQRQQLYDVKPA
jgi:hypothetical protein